MVTWNILALFGMLVGLVAVLGGIWALLKQTVVVDQAGQVTSIDIPFLGKMKTNFPSLIAVFLGVALVGFVMNKVSITDENVKLVGGLKVEDLVEGSTVVVGVIPAGYSQPVTSGNGQESMFQIDVDKGSSYTVIAYAVTAIENGRPVYSLVAGPAVMDTEGRTLKYSGVLAGRQGTRIDAPD